MQIDKYGKNSKKLLNIMTIQKQSLSEILENTSERLGLTDKGQHLVALFPDNESQHIVGWAIVDNNNNVIKKFGSMQDLDKYFEIKH